MSARLPPVPDGILSERQLVGEEERLKARGLTVEQAMADLCRILAHCEGDFLGARSIDCGRVLEIDKYQALNVVNRKLPLGPKLLDAMYGAEPGSTLNDDWLAEPADWGPIRPHHWVGDDDDDAAPAAAPVAAAVAPAPAIVAPTPAAVAPAQTAAPPAPPAPVELAISAAPGSSRSPVAADGYSVQGDAAPAPAPKTIADIAARVAGKPLAEAAREVAEIRADDAIAVGDRQPALVPPGNPEAAAPSEQSDCSCGGRTTIVINPVALPDLPTIRAVLRDGLLPAAVAMQPDSPMLPAIAAIDGQMHAVFAQVAALIDKAQALGTARTILLEAA